MEREYKNTLFTTHAIERLKLRRVSQDMAVQALRKPDDKMLEEDGDTRFIKTIDGRKVQVVARYLNDEKKWLVISAWVRGEEDPKPLWVRLLMLPVQLLKKIMGSRKRGRGDKRSRKP